MDVGEDTTGGNGGSTHEFVELVVVTDGHLDVSGDDSGSLEILGGVSGKLEDLSCEVLEDGGEVDGGTGSDSGGEFTGLHVSGDSSDGELESSSGRSADGTSGTTLSFSFSSSSSCGHYLFIRLVIIYSNRGPLKYDPLIKLTCIRNKQPIKSQISGRRIDPIGLIL